MTRAEVQIDIDALIDRFAERLDDDDFIEALEEMEDRASMARAAREEELDRDS
jgi:hypothetical protein